jgi:hypothetical protein
VRGSTFEKVVIPPVAVTGEEKRQVYELGSNAVTSL